MYDIIPDIHGQLAKLESALTNLGYRIVKGVWRHSDPGRTCIFLGDYIDRGPENAAVINTVRRMVDAGTAQAIMGNHELNAIHFHTNVAGRPLRPHSVKNRKQHASFLREFPPEAPATQDVINWMATLPLFLEFDGFRVVHACWYEQKIAALAKITGNGVLSREQIINAADPRHDIFDLVETAAKGPECPLPDGYFITGKDGTRRHDVRLKWWNPDATSWSGATISVPDPAQLPAGDLPRDITAAIYPAEAKPVLFGHYWLTGTPRLQARNAVCLDYCAGTDGPLVSYRFAQGETALDLERVTVHPPAG